PSVGGDHDHLLWQRCTRGNDRASRSGSSMPWPSVSRTRTCPLFSPGALPPSKGPCCMSFPESGDALLALLRCKAPGVVPGRRTCVGKRSKPCAIARELFARACGDTRRPVVPVLAALPGRLRTKCERRRTAPYAFRRLDVAQWVLGRAYN